jgi:hypothetical protein
VSIKYNAKLLSILNPAFKAEGIERGVYVAIAGIMVELKHMFVFIV